MAFSAIGSVEQESGATTKGASSPITLTVAVPDLAANCVGVVILCIQGGIGTHVISGATWGGEAMTSAVTSGSSSFGVYVWEKFNPLDNANRDIQVTFSAPAVAASITYHLVVGYASAGSEVSRDDTSTASGTSQNPAITSTQANGNEFVISASVSTANNVGSPTVSDCTELQNYVVGGNASIVAYSVPGSSGNATHTHNYSQSGTYEIVSISFKEAVSNTSPSVTQDTADHATKDTLAVLEFTGTDPDSDAIRYNINIIDNPDAWTSGSELEDNNPTTGSSGQVHPNPASSGLTWEGRIPVDDRCGQSFTGNGGILDKVAFYFAGDQTNPENCDGTAVVRIYEHAGVYGTSSAPANAAAPANTPTSGWLAISDENVYDDTLGSTKDWRQFTFSGVNRIRLVDGTHYMAILDWWPNNRTYTNTIAVLAAADANAVHAGNAYLDGGDASNNGVWGPDAVDPKSNMDFCFRVYEYYTLLDKVSGTDAGFSNVDTPADTDPFNSGDTVSFTVQAADELTEGSTYRWRVRGIDPTGSANYGNWSATRDFTTSGEAPAGPTARVAGSVGGVGDGARHHRQRIVLTMFRRLREKLSAYLDHQVRPLPQRS